jgi:hypothetical protein
MATETAELSLDRQEGILIDRRTGRRRDPETGSTAEWRDGFFLLHLRGDPYHRGLAHGKLLRREILDSKVAQYYAGFVAQLYRSSHYGRMLPGPLSTALGSLLEAWYYTPLEKLLLPETRQELEGVAEALGFAPREVVRCYLAPDVMEHLAAGFLAAGKQALGNYYLGGCSAVYARRTALRAGGEALLARNMDFPGVLVWRYPTIIFAHPSEEVETAVKGADGVFRKVTKRKQPYMYVSTAGFPGTGLTGMSASGVACVTFVCLSKNVSSRAPLFLDFNHYLLTRAESLEGIRWLLSEEALVSASPHVVLFAGSEEAMSVEVDSTRAVVRSMPRDFDFHVQTNHYLNPLLKRREMEFPLEREYTIGRFRLLNDAMEQNYGRIDRQRLVDIISCNLDWGSMRTRLLGDFPAQFFTLTSVLFEPATGNFWVASGRPPAVCYHEYRGFNLFRQLAGQGRRVRLPPLSRSAVPVLRGSRFRRVDEKAQRSLRYLALSQEELNQGKRRAALAALRKAASLHPDPGYDYLSALLLMMLGESGSAFRIFRQLEQAGAFTMVKGSALVLWEGRCLDLLGRRQEARRCYRRLLRESGLVAELRKAAGQGLRSPFRQSRMPVSLEYYLLGPLSFLSA